MRIDPWVGTYLNSKCALKGEGMSFSRRKEANLPSDPCKRPGPDSQRLPISSPESYSIVKEQSSVEMEDI